MMKNRQLIILLTCVMICSPVIGIAGEARTQVIDGETYICLPPEDAGQLVQVAKDKYPMCMQSLERATLLVDQQEKLVLEYKTLSETQGRALTAQIDLGVNLTEQNAAQKVEIGTKWQGYFWVAVGAFVAGMILTAGLGAMHEKGWL